MRGSTPKPGPTGEFDLIASFFTASGAKRNDVLLGVGDDAALLELSPHEAVITRAATVSGVTEAPATARALVADAEVEVERAGAKARWATLALTLPSVEQAWLRDFAVTLNELLVQRDIALVGGDTTQGPFAITLLLTGVTQTHTR